MSKQIAHRGCNCLLVTFIHLSNAWYVYSVALTFDLVSAPVYFSARGMSRQQKFGTHIHVFIQWLCHMSLSFSTRRQNCIGVGAESTVGGGKTFLPEKCVKNRADIKIQVFFIFFSVKNHVKFGHFVNNAQILHDSCRKNYKNTWIFMIFAGKKLTKFRNFAWFLPKSAQILHNNCHKNIPPPCRPVSYAYAVPWVNVLC